MKKKFFFERNRFFTINTYYNRLFFKSTHFLIEYFLLLNILQSILFTFFLKWHFYNRLFCILKDIDNFVKSAHFKPHIIIIIIIKKKKHIFKVTFERSTEEGTKQVKRTLFGSMNPYPQKKIITFNKHTSDFSFNVNYADLENLPAEEREYLGSPNISEYHLIGVADALKKNTGENVETKGIKNIFFIYFLIQFVFFFYNHNIVYSTK